MQNLPAWQRRLVTVPIVLIMWLVAILLAPPLLVVAILVDMVRRLRSRTPPIAWRLYTFLIIYLTAEVGAILGSLWIWLISPFGSNRQRIVMMTFGLQRWWATFLWESACLIFGFHLEVEGRQLITPGPILVLSRHASIVDNLLPFQVFTRHDRIRLRYVFKKELLLDPAIDIAGNNLLSHFVDRKGTDTDRELAALRRLATDLRSDEGVLIYPEGTRYSPEKRERALAALGKSPRLLALGQGLHNLLPPRLGGVTALLDVSSADVIVMGHKGLEGFARIKDIWSSGMLGSEVRVRLWRIARSEVPEGRRPRIEWLYGVWTEMDRWLTGTHALEARDG
ncbi:MAG TPA: lysophospholipid acyltransferase family protein [Acidimicrobiia bacterium]|nr:lysophospholipid acyltransferase family protein [Acidimicrobiia bacterium]